MRLRHLPLLRRIYAPFSKRAVPRRLENAVVLLSVVLPLKMHGIWSGGVCSLTTTACASCAFVT